jgi:2'-5' RNA ligase
MERRLFIAIPLPETTIQMLDAVLGDVDASLPRSVRLVPQELWHITVLFLGDQDDESLPGIDAALRSMYAGKELPIEFERVTYGPPGRPPRMVWATTTEETSAHIGALKQRLETELARNGIEWGHSEHGSFTGHVTLARFESRDGLQPVDERMSEQFIARDLVLFESHLSPEGPTYQELLRAPL